MMPDIAMCANANCPSRHKCFRYMARPCEHRQSYALGLEPDDSGRCWMYSHVYPGSTRIRTPEEADAANAKKEPTP